jgi:hypothetical protein
MAVNIGSTGSSTGETTLAERAARALAKEKSVTEFWRKSWRWATWIVFANQMIILVLLAGVLLR